MFIINFSDGTSLTEYEVKWDNIPDKPILRLKYILPNNKSLVMEGFKEYTIIKEYYKFLYGAKGTKLDTVNILGKYNDKVYQFSVHIRKGKAIQTKNELTAEFRPMKLTTKPSTKKQKEYLIELGSAIKINEKCWKKGSSLIPTSVRID